MKEQIEQIGQYDRDFCHERVKSRVFIKRCPTERRLGISSFGKVAERVTIEMGESGKFFLILRYFLRSFAPIKRSFIFRRDKATNVNAFFPSKNNISPFRVPLL